ncbi:MAG: hypothetical protein P8X74_05395 [Reinekea sp.]
MQAEQRKLQQTLVLKQDELTKTASENTRLFTPKTGNSSIRHSSSYDKNSKKFDA